MLMRFTRSMGIRSSAAQIRISITLNFILQHSCESSNSEILIGSIVELVLIKLNVLNVLLNNVKKIACYVFDLVKQYYDDLY